MENHIVRTSWQASLAVAVAAALVGITGCSSASAQGSKAPQVNQAGVVCNVKVVSDKVKDVSSIEAWKKSYISDSMTPQEKAIAVWTSMVSHQHQESPPSEYLQTGGLVVDPIKIMNVYGYSFCSVAASEMCELGKVAGLKARGLGIKTHNVMEFGFDDSWHMFDASLINYFPKPDGTIASADEISAQVRGWLEQHPELRGDGKKLTAYHFADGKTGWKKGPVLLTNCPWYTPTGWWPAKTHGWYSTMQEYDIKPFITQDTPSLSYSVNIQLRQGEKLTRNWSNKGLHINMDGGGAPGCIGPNAGTELLFHTAKFGNLAPGRIGNGLLEYDALSDKALPTTALTYENLTIADGKLRVKDGSRNGVLVIRMPSSYVYLTGAMDLTAAVGNGGGITASFSDNNGLDWKDLANVSAAGAQKIDLSKKVFRRYDYRVKFELKGAGTGLDALSFKHDIQHSQRPLPALAEGENTISFSAGEQLSTMRVEGSIEDFGAKQLRYTSFHPEMAGLNDRLGGTGSLTFPVQTPGELKSIRAGCFYRGPADSYQVQVSYDGGKTFKTISTTPTLSGDSANSLNPTTTDIPADMNTALVRYAVKGGVALDSFWIVLDYKPAAAGFRPVKVTYAWDEGGTEKTDVHIARSPQDAYKIVCAAKPTMKNITLELAE